MSRSAATRQLKMLRDAPTAGLVKLRCGKGFTCQRPLWAVRVACKNSVGRILILSVCGHSSVALNHMTNSVKLDSAFRISSQ